MNDKHKTKAELIKELEALRQQVAHWEEVESKSRYAEEASKESQRRYWAVVENSPLGVWEMNPDGTTSYLNQSMCSMLEIESPEDLNGKTHHSFFTSQSLETIAKENDKRSQDFASISEVEIIGKKGGKRTVLIQGTLISSSEGELKSLIGIFIDITERNLAIENLRKWAYIFEYADWGVGIVGAKGKMLVLMNPAFARMHGYTEEELIGRPITDVFAPECQDEVPEQIWMGHEKEHHIIESKHIRKDGTVFSAQIDVTIVKDKEGRVQFRAVHVQDITERKRTEEKVRASLTEKEILLQEIHHRVKNNLQLILSLFNLQSRYLGDEKSREIFLESRERVRVMADIHTMLYQSKNLSRVNFGGFIKDLTGRLRQSYGIAGLTIEVHVEPADLSLSIKTSISCGLILNELVSNALKHAFPEGRGGEVNISMATVGGRFVLKVQDNGIGFPKALDFENTQTLGLELVRLLVGQINGTIDLQVERGTSLTITFPAIGVGG